MIPEPALEFILAREGGFSDHPRDPGGRTNFGITQRVYDGYRRRKKLIPTDVKQISRAEVREIYDVQYWRDAGCDRIEATGRAGLALCHLDAAVNTGIGQATKHLQRAVVVGADGVFGPQTLAAVAACDELPTIGRYLELREAFYRDLAARRGLQVFLRSWLFRLKHLQRATGAPYTLPPEVTR